MVSRAMKDVSRFFGTLQFFGSVMTIFQWHLWFGKDFKCLTGSDLRKTFPCSFHLVITFRLVSLHEQSPWYTLQAGHGFLSFKENSDLNFLVDHFTMNSNLSRVKYFNFFDNRLLVSHFCHKKVFQLNDSCLQITRLAEGYWDKSLEGGGMKEWLGDDCH